MTVANEALGGDPVPGAVKALRIRYRLDDGPQLSREYPEGAEVELP
jgi:hypothetical protein